LRDYKAEEAAELLANSRIMSWRIDELDAIDAPSGEVLYDDVGQQVGGSLHTALYRHAYGHAAGQHPII
jgi:hypothetical protein